MWKWQFRPCHFLFFLELKKNKKNCVHTLANGKQRVAHATLKRDAVNKFWTQNIKIRSLPLHAKHHFSTLFTNTFHQQYPFGYAAVERDFPHNQKKKKKKRHSNSFHKLKADQNLYSIAFGYYQATCRHHCSRQTPASNT